MNVSSWLVDRNVAEGRSDSVALLCRGERHTYGELQSAVSRFAGGLLASGLRPEERVVLSLLDSFEFVWAFLGAIRAGVIPVLVNPLLPSRDVDLVVRDAGARLVLASAERAPTDPLTAPVILTGSQDWRALAGGPDVDALPTPVDATAFLLCTSGTTGRPKLAVHRHADLPFTADAYARTVLGVRPSDLCYSVGPAFHAYGLGNSVTFPMSVGATALLEPTRPPTPARVAELVSAHRPTLFFCVPTFYAALCNSDIADDTFASVRCAVSAAESLPAPVFHRFKERFGVEILDGIGSTEMTHIFISNKPGATFPGTSGTPVAGYEVELRSEDGTLVAQGDPGQLWVKGESAATGYWRRTAVSRATFVGEWTRTGDLYTCDLATGAHTYLGRVDEMFKVGGEWVSPAEVEAALMEHPGVLEAAVVGERDDAGALRPVAFVVARIPDASPDEGDLIAFVRPKLAGYKRPRRITVVTELPKTATGKIQRYRLRS